MDYTRDDYTLKADIIEKAKELGAHIIGFAPVDRWEEFKDTSIEYYPQNIWPGTKTIIVLGLQIFLPVLETTPSIVNCELYNTVNRLLDEIAYKLAAYLYKLGQKAFFFSRDSFGNNSDGSGRHISAFSQVLAGKYAGLGTVGYNHTLLTKEFGPRVRLVSVFTDANIIPDKMLEKELCFKCEVCKRCCPTSDFTTATELISKMDIKKCTDYHDKLKDANCYPCGVCIKVCPVDMIEKYMDKIQKNIYWKKKL